MDIHGPSTFGGIICAIEVIPPCLVENEATVISLTSRLNSFPSAESENISCYYNNNDDI